MFRPWASIWCSPRMTIRQIVAESPNRSFWCLAAIYGFSSLLNTFQSIYLGLHMPLLGILLLAAVLSPFWGYVFFSIWGWIVTVTGKWLKGTAPFLAVRAAYSWSCVPLLINIPLWLLLAAVFGQDLFVNFSQGAILTGGQASLLFLVLLIRLGAAIWSLVLYVNALAEVQGFSILRALGNILISGAIIGIVSYVLLLLFNSAFHATMSLTVFLNEPFNSLRPL